MKTNRKFDSAQEQIVNYFAHKYFFSKIDKNSQMVDDVTLQLNGVDELCCGKNVDLKAQSSKRYINSPTDTFILEISFIDRGGNPAIGWFLKDGLVTDEYAFIWIPKASVNEFGAIASSEDISEMEIMLVDKHKLHDYILSIESKDCLIESSDMMRSTATTWKEISNHTPGIHLSHNTILAEKPVVLVVKKWLLKKFATKHCIVKKDCIIDL